MTTPSRSPDRFVLLVVAAIFALLTFWFGPGSSAETAPAQSAATAPVARP